MDGGRTDLDLRRLRSFVAVAERLHFGQAAAALHVTRPALSRQIQQLEHDLGVTLFRRDSREAALTPAGEQFLQDSRNLLAAARAAQTRVRRIAAGEGVLKVGFMLSSGITAPLHAFSAREPQVRVELVRLRWWSRSAALLDGTADVGFVRLPVDAERLRVLPLYREGTCAVLPVRHPLAGEDAVGLRALADEPLLRYAGASPAWSAVRNADPAPTAPRGGTARTSTTGGDPGVRPGRQRDGAGARVGRGGVPAPRHRLRAGHRRGARHGRARLGRQPSVPARRHLRGRDAGDGLRCHSSHVWINTCPVILPSRNVSIDSESTRTPSG